MTDERGFHLEIHVLGNKEIHYHDKESDRFEKQATKMLANFLSENGMTRQYEVSTNPGELYAQNITIKWHTV